MKYAYLIRVEAEANNNKFYEMREEEGSGYFSVSYGRVGGTAIKDKYPMSLWDKKYREKLSSRKGYKDITHLRATSTTDSNQEDHLAGSRIVVDIFRYLLAATRETVSKNYLMPVSGVTQAMVDEAQGLLDSLVSLRDQREWYKFNRNLQDLFMVLPRNMRSVADNILPLNVDYDLYDRAGVIISSEQDTLDSLKGQIVVVHDQVETRSTLFETMGISVTDITADNEQMIKSHLGEIYRMYYQAVAIENVKTRKRFDDWLSTVDDKTEMVLWHGSRTQNWVSLLQQGLVRYPTNAVITGKMFGYGLYFAPKAKKSLGYTSHGRAYWTSGKDDRGYMGLFRVHTGKMKKYRTAQSGLTYDEVKRMGYHSVMGEAGYSLQNDEIIVYNEAQTDISFLVELR